MNNAGDNQLGKIPDTTKEQWSGGYEIVHVRLKIDPRGKGHPLEFGLEQIEKTPPVEELDDYLQLLAAQPLHPRNGVPVAPYDVGVDKQCWLIFELDGEVPNWRFCDHGMTSKAAPSDWQFGLRYVLRNGAVGSGAIPDDQDCRLIYLAIARRGSYPDDHHYFNLHVEFVQGDGTVDNPRKRLKVIFDPDVSNTGGFFPPP